MFELKLTENIDLFKNSVSIISEMLDEAVFNVNEEGFGLLSADRAMIVVIDYLLKKPLFESFSASGENKIGLNMRQFDSILRRAKSTDKLSLSFEDNTNRLKIVIKNTGERTFEIPLLEISTEKPPVDSMTFNTKIKVKTELLEDGISDADIVDDSVVFETTDNGFRMYAKGDITASEMLLNTGEDLTIEANGKAKARYPLEYLKKIIKSKDFASEVTIEYADNYPFRMVFDNENIRMGFVLAPRVEEVEEPKEEKPEASTSVEAELGKQEQVEEPKPEEKQEFAEPTSGENES